MQSGGLVILGVLLSIEFLVGNETQIISHKICGYLMEAKNEQIHQDSFYTATGRGILSPDNGHGR